MSQLQPDQSALPETFERDPPRPPCPAPANLRAEVARFDARAHAGHWDSPRYRVTYRTLGEGPPLVLVPGIASTYRTYALLLNLLSERFQTVLYDYPGEHRHDSANLARISHGHLVDDLFGLIDHLKIGRAFLVGVSFGSTVVLKALHREPRRFPRAAVQGAFAFRGFSRSERWALRLGRLVPGTAARLPFRRMVLAYNNKAEYPAIMEDRWRFHLEDNGRTPIRSLAHRVGLLADFDLRPILAQIPTETLLIQGNEDRIVARRYFDELKTALPRAHGMILPTVGHQPHLTHADMMARLLVDWLLRCPPGGCTEIQRSHGGCGAPRTFDQDPPSPATPPLP
jgi:pimeloyl-ACP methyl ester carboxylesterase